MKHLQHILMILMLGLMAGCAHISKPLDNSIAKSIEPEPGKALVIAYWDGLGTVEAWPVFLFDNKKVVNVIERKSKVYYQAEPGRRVLAVGTDNLVPFSGYDYVFFDANLEAGKVYYIAISAYRATTLPASLTGVHLKAYNPTFQDGDEAAAAMTLWLNNASLATISPDGYKEFEDDKDDALERYDEQLAAWKALPEHQRIKLRPSQPSTYIIKLHAGKWM